MAKESFNWKGLFINEETDATVQTNKPQTTFTPPAQVTKFPNEATQTVSSDSLSNPFLKEVFEVYEKGFESLNSAGFDFFEMYKSVMSVGISNPQSYQMAFTMGKTIQPDLNKQFLLDKASFYISEIEKVYAKYDAIGKSKKSDVENNLTKEKYSLSKSIEELSANILQLQNELEVKKTEFQKLDSNNVEKFSEIKLKIEANDLAKQKILESINTVVTGINQYL
ncbi:MAG: hypothetical protein ABI554_15030 [Flavobacterium sp.]